MGCSRPPLPPPLSLLPPKAAFPIWPPAGARCRIGRLGRRWRRVGGHRLGPADFPPPGKPRNREGHCPMHQLFFATLLSWK